MVVHRRSGSGRGVPLTVEIFVIGEREMGEDEGGCENRRAERRVWFGYIYIIYCGRLGLPLS